MPRTQHEEEVEPLEEVALDDPKPQPAKKRGMFSRLMDSESHSERPGSQPQEATKSSWHHFGGRKRGQSGSGAELGAIPKREETPKAESQLKHEERQSTPVKHEERQPTPVKPEERQPTPQAISSAENSQAPVVNGVS